MESIENKEARVMVYDSIEKSMNLFLSSQKAYDHNRCGNDCEPGGLMHHFQLCQDSAVISLPDEQLAVENGHVFG